jgi:hypothetical protein
MKVHPAMFMKTKERAKAGAKCTVSGARRTANGRGNGIRIGTAAPAPDFCLLSPVSCSQKMKVHPAMFMKTKGRKNCH